MHGVLVGAYSIAASVLVVSGVWKIARPAGITRAISTLGFAAPRFSGRMLGVVEASVGGFGLLGSGVIPSVLVAGAYGLFVVAVIILMRRGDVSSCGCFGEVESPPSAFHLAFNLNAMLVAFGHAAVGGWEGLGPFARETPASGVPFLAFIIIGSASSIAMLTMVPRVAALRRTLATEAGARHSISPEDDSDVRLSP